jgi:hypothetical protein
MKRLNYGNEYMNRNAAKAELLALVQMTQEALTQSKSRVSLTDENSLSVYRVDSFQTISPQKISSPIKKSIIPQSTPSPILNREEEAHEETIEPSRHIRDVNRLLPRSFGAPAQDISVTRDAMSKIDGMPHLSASPMYSGSPKTRTSQWAICTYIDAQESSQRSLFIEAVSKAIRERLSVETTPLSCDNPTFVKLFPMVLDDCEAVLFFVDQHLEQKLRELLCTIPLHDPTPHSVSAPFILLGTLHKKPLRAVLLKKNTHEDPAIKQQLWTGIRGLSVERPKKT